MSFPTTKLGSRYTPEIRPTWMAYGLFTLKFLLLAGLIAIQALYSEDLTKLAIPQHFVRALLFFLTGQLVVSFSRTSLAAIYRRRGRWSRSRRDNFILGINQIAGIASFLVFVIAMLMVFDIEIREALTAISIVAAAIAILSKDYVANMINGMILMFSDQISLDDQIQIGEHRGKIVDISLMHVQLLNDDDDLIFIPNSHVLTEEIINYTRRPIPKTSIEFEIDSHLVPSVEGLEQQIITMLKPVSDQIEPGSYTLKVVAVKKDSLQLKFQCVMRDRQNTAQVRDLRRTLNRGIVSLQHSLREQSLA